MCCVLRIACCVGEPRSTQEAWITYSAVTCCCYQFDLRTNVLTAKWVPNPHAGREHAFCALRHQTGPDTAVVLRVDSAQGGLDEEQ